MTQLTDTDLNWAVGILGALSFFPSASDGGARSGVKVVLRNMIETRIQLEWLVSVFINRIGRWHGPAELRAVYCTKFKPLDGIEGWSQLDGFTALDSESAGSLKHHKNKMIEANNQMRGTQSKSLEAIAAIALIKRRG